MPLDRGEVAAGHGLGRLLGEVLHGGEFTSLQAAGDPFDLFLARDEFWPGGGVVTVHALGPRFLGQIHRGFQVLPQHMISVFTPHLDDSVLPLRQLIGEDSGWQHIFLIHKHNVPGLPAHLSLNGEDDQQEEQGEKGLSHNFHKLMLERLSAKAFLRFPHKPDAKEILDKRPVGSRLRVP